MANELTIIEAGRDIGTLRSQRFCCRKPYLRYEYVAQTENFEIVVLTTVAGLAGCSPSYGITWVRTTPATPAITESGACLQMHVPYTGEEVLVDVDNPAATERELADLRPTELGQEAYDAWKAWLGGLGEPDCGQSHDWWDRVNHEGRQDDYKYC